MHEHKPLKLETLHSKPIKLKPMKPKPVKLKPTKFKPMMHQLLEPKHIEAEVYTRA